MNILAIAAYLPAFDRASGDLRLFRTLQILARSHSVALATFKSGAQRVERGEPEVTRYRAALEQAGIAVLEDKVAAALRRGRADIVLFMTHRAAAKWLERARFEQPGARMIVDSVDCHFARLERYAELTGSPDDLAAAATERALELDAYSRADMVMAVTEDDCRLLAECLPGKPLAVVPNIHMMPASDAEVDRVPGRIVFVGGFKHEPNVDAIRHFCADILPLIRAEIPSAEVLVAGSDPPPAVRALAGHRVEVLGYLPDLAPLLRSAAVSVAPLRYGAGLKGKVGEAMSFALPVVTTPIGAEGFGIESGTHAIVAEDPAQFAGAVVRLLREPALARRIGENGRALVAKKFSECAVTDLVSKVLQRAARVQPRTLPARRRLKIASSLALERNLLWRFR